MKYLTSIDLGNNQLLNVALQILATAPASPVLGQLFYNSTANTPQVWDGSQWLTLDVTKVANSSIPLAKLATDPLARSNHTGTQLASTISDFNTAVRTNRLDQLATPTASVNLGNQKITGVQDGTAAGEVVTYQQMLDAIAGVMARKEAVRVLSSSNITLSGLQTIDGITVAAGDRVLVVGQTTGSQNGFYVAASGAWTRSADANTSSEVKPGTSTFVSEGTVNGNTTWQLITDGPITLDTTSLTFAQIGASTTYGTTVGGALTKDGSNNFSVNVGYGITITSNALAVDTTKIASKFVATIGDGSATSFALGHNLGNQDVTISVRQTGSPFAQVMTDVEYTNTNTVTIKFNTAPTSGQYRVIVVG